MIEVVQPSELGGYHAVSDGTLLAAVDRAQCHLPRGGELGAAWHDIVEHLGFVRDRRMTRMLQPQLRALLADGFLQDTTARGFAHYRLTDTGRRRLAGARRSGDAPLPEAPQHRLWRHRRAQAREQLDTLVAELSDTLREASELLETRQHGNSTAWADLCGRLGSQSGLLASVLYCGREWAEPDDTRALEDRTRTHLAVLERSDRR